MSKEIIPAIAQTPIVGGVRDGIPIEKGVGMTTAFLEENFELFSQYGNLFLQYPDLLIDMVTPKDSTFKLYFYQRIFMRTQIRYRYSYQTFTRAFSKSFLSILTMIVRCILLPGSKLFICADVLRQAVKIGREKIDEIFGLFPLLEKEVLSYHKSQDYLTLTFYNGSILDVVGVQTSTRGGRRH